MFVKESLRQYTRPAVERYHAKNRVARPISMNPYFQLEQRLLWPESLLPSFGERCRKAMYVNGYHVLLCRRRIFVVRDGQVFSFPPFDSFVQDVYVESIDKENLLLVIAHDEGVHVGRMRCEAAGELTSEVEDEASVPTPSPVVKVHRLKRNLFCLCYADGAVQSLVVRTTDGGELFTDLQPVHHTWLATAASMLLLARRRSYRDSFFDNRHSRLVVLTDRDVSVWVYKDEHNLQVGASAPVPEDSAAVVPPGNRQEEVASLVLRSGAKMALSLQPSKKAGAAVTLARGPEVALPGTVADIISVVAAREEANATVLYDDVTASVVVMGQESHTPSEPIIASQVNLPEKLVGIGFSGSSGAQDSGTFWLYADGPVAFRLERVSMGTRLQQQFASSRFEAVQFLRTLPATQRAALAMEAALDGLPLGDVEGALEPLVRPVLLDDCTMSLSPAAEGFTHFLMGVLDELQQLCTSVPYWELAADLDKARKRALRCGELLQGYLRPRGWLDCVGELPQRVQWVRFHAVSPEPLNEISSRYCQGLFLATLLSVLRHAATCAWLYSLLLDAGAGDRFTRTMLPSLWTTTSDPAEAEALYVSDLLQCENADIAARLEAERELLPNKAQLAVRMQALAHADPAAALQLASNHISDIVRYGAFKNTAELLEKHAPEKLPRLRLLLQQYRSDHSTSTAILDLLKGLPAADDSQKGANPLRRHLECVFADEAARDLHGVVLDWMEGHPLDDKRIETFANVIASLDMDVSLSNTLTGTFFACWRQEIRGDLAVAARGFGKLARTPLEVPLWARLLCVSHARRYDPGDEDKHTEFILLLQNQLAELLGEHANATRPRLVVPFEQVQLDVTALTLHFLDESALFEVAGRYHELGGASIQLDILKIHNDAPEEVTAETLAAMLTFLKAAGRTGAEAAQMVLREYLGNFESVLPLFPFVMFLAFDGTTCGEVAAALLDCGVNARGLFEVLLNLIDSRGREPLFPVCDILQALIDVVERVPTDQQNMCVSYLVECIRAMLAGEYRSLSLAQSDVFSLRSMDALLEKRLCNRA